MTRAFVPLLTLLILAIPTWARTSNEVVSDECNARVSTTVRLYPGDRVARDYGKRVLSIKAGDTIDFGDKKFKILSVLGQGDTTRIFEIAGERALRVPLALPKAFTGLKGDQPTYEWITSFLETYKLLRADNIPMVEIDEKNSRPPRYLIVEKIDVLFTLEEFNKQEDEMDSDLRKRAKKALGEFARSTWRYTWVSDFRPDQIGFDGTRWILFDLGGQQPTQALRNWDQSKTIFSNFKITDSWGVSKEKVVDNKKIRKYLESIVEEERETRQAQGEWFERSKDGGWYLIPALELVSDLPGQTIEYSPRPWEKSHFTIRILKEHTRKKNSIFYDVNMANGNSALLEVLVKIKKNGPFDNFDEFYSEDFWRDTESLDKGADFRLFQMSRGTLEDHI